VIAPLREVCDHSTAIAVSAQEPTVGASGQQVGEVVDGVDFTRDRNVGRSPARQPSRGDRLGRDNYRPGADQPGAADGPSSARRTSSSSSWPQDDQAAVAWPRHDPDDDVIFVGDRPTGGDLDHIDTRRRRPIDTVDRPRAPAQLFQICKAKRLQGLAATTESNV